MLDTQQELKKYLLNKRRNGEKRKVGQMEERAESEDGPQIKMPAMTSLLAYTTRCLACGPKTPAPSPLRSHISGWD